CLTWSSLWMGDLLGSFPESVLVRTKHAEKTRVGLWGQLAILKADWGVTPSLHTHNLSSGPLEISFLPIGA
ncbi:hypothetical protein A2U01_0068205, partial [Trifolium medium]|nr:hypothetical protein [Trifolium medium]